MPQLLDSGLSDSLANRLHRSDAVSLHEEPKEVSFYFVFKGHSWNTATML